MTKAHNKITNFFTKIKLKTKSVQTDENEWLQYIN